MRVDVKKFLFLGLKNEKELFYREAQKLGLIDFISLQAGGAVKDDVHHFAEAIKILRGLPPMEQLEGVSASWAKPVADEIVHYKKEIDLLDEKLRVIALDISRIGPFGPFSLEDIAFIEERGKRALQFYCGKKGSFEKFSDEPNLLYIASENGLDYFVGIAPEPAAYEGLVEMKIDTPLQMLEEQAKEAEREKAVFEQKLKAMAKYSHFLHLALNDEVNRASLHQAKANAEESLEGALFTATGWVPENKIEELKTLSQKLDVHMEEISVEEKDAVPTYLENSGASRIGEDLVGIYDTPSTGDKDPSMWVLFAFLLFFAIIVGDGGYGSVYLGLALYLRYKFPDLKGLKKRLLNLFTLLCAACIAWGVLTSTYFGIILPPENPLRKISLVTYMAEKKAEYHYALQDATYHKWLIEYPALGSVQPGGSLLESGYSVKDGVRNYSLLSSLSDQVLLELALLIGVVHIILGLLRYLPRNYSNSGWILFLIGSWLYFPMYLQAPSFVNYWLGVPIDRAGPAGLQLIEVGIPLAVILAVIRNGLLGLTELMNLIQVFADVLSYLRLYALGLSGSIVSATINDVASLLPFVFSVVLILIGHAVNMLLGIMGGVIHGLRLNFLEWYHYSFEGGGKQFKPLKIKQLD